MITFQTVGLLGIVLFVLGLIFDSPALMGLSIGLLFSAGVLYTAP